MRILFWLTVFLSVASLAPLYAESAPLEGSWSGSGTMQQAKGGPEKVSCRISYKREAEKVFRVDAKCATTSNKINQSGQLLMVNPEVYVGEFHVADYDISGRLRIVVKGSVQTMTFESSRGHGSVTLKKF